MDIQEEKISGANLAARPASDPLPNAHCLLPAAPLTLPDEADPAPETLSDSLAAALAEYLTNFAPYASPAPDPKADSQPAASPTPVPAKPPPARPSGRPPAPPNFGNPGLFKQLRGTFC